MANCEWVKDLFVSCEILPDLASTSVPSVAGKKLTTEVTETLRVLRVKA